ncbi:hypothetical protein QBC47DRAFT_23368 [Echria macrotheca]|uniref:Myb-like DNA-binding domain-containing protein n=1 Tax=Echria macrotheca TaxID=438768 RepID=A0AAJ0FHK2_9PEZI|nr:hypothetical protein QBC47DRAFT_23368 [Echria macrotheca]
MSANDNAMTRFLFAILQQKCLKDIDWNKVAHDPILAQEITNGHAARMRYSRFRAAMLGIEPQRRNRTNPNRTRVSKKKKDDAGKAKKDDQPPGPTSGSGIKSETTGPVKHERDNGNIGNGNGYLDRAETPTAGSLLSPKIKKERMFAPTTAGSPAAQQHHHHHSTTLASLAGPSAMSDLQFRQTMRLLTPCSDSDMLAAAASSQGFGGHPSQHSPSASDMLHSSDAAVSFDFCRDPTHGGQTDAASAWVMSHHHHQPAATSGSNGYTAAANNGFGGGLGISYGGPPGGNGGAGAGGEDCYSPFWKHEEHQHQPGLVSHHHGIVPDELGVHAILEEGGQAMVKHEDWDALGYH